jgi:hypothetical protein
MYDDLNSVALTNIVYGTTGSAGSRILTVQFSNMQFFGNATPNLSFQIKIYESDGHIEFIYGTMTAGTATYTYTCGINAATISAVPTAAQLSTQQTANTGTFNATPQNLLATVPESNSMLSFAPNPPQTAPNSPTSLTFTNTGSSTTTLNWNDNSSDEIEFPVYISTDNVNFSYIGAAAANAVSIPVVNLAPSTTYYFQVWAAKETKFSTSSANGNVTTLATVPLSGAFTINPAAPISSTNFQTFSQADTALSNNGVNGPCVFTVSSGVYAEQSLLGPIFGTSSTNTVKFVGPVADARVLVKPVGGAATNDFAIAIIGADWVTYENIDVEDGGTSIANQIEYGYLIQSNGASNGAQNNTVTGARIKLGGSGVAPGFSHGVLISNSTSTEGNSGCKVLNCTIDRSDRGIADFAFSGASPDDNIEVSGNILGSTHYIGDSLTGTSGSAIGIIVSFCTNVIVSDNQILSVKARHPSNGQSSPIGISGQNCQGDFFNNKISGIVNEGTSSTVRAIGIRQVHY